MQGSRGLGLKEDDSDRGGPPSQNSSEPDSAPSLLRTLEQEVDLQIGDLVEGPKRAVIVERVTEIVTSEKFSGPIAHPRHLAAYEATCPGAADRIISMAERSLAHRFEMEKVEAGQRRLGLWLGASTFAALIGGAVLAVVLSAHPAIPGIFLGTAALGGVGLFVGRR